jgi:PHD/YefM family antitoxin component YafN of YafNO toxin-antitoxin module
MKTLDINTEPASLAESVRALGDEPVVLVEEGQPVAVLLALDNVDLETVSLTLNPEFRAILERSRRRQQAEGSLSGEEVRRRLGVQPPAQKKKKARGRSPEVKRSSARVKREQ